MSFFENAIGIDAQNGTFNCVQGDQLNMNITQPSNDQNTLALLKPVRPLDVPGCMRGTRQDIFKTIDTWLNDFHAPNILLISGSPGAGKSAIASSLVSELTQKRRLGSYFTFKRGDTSLGNPNSLWRTVAFDLCRFDCDVRAALVDCLKRPCVRDADIELHFKLLIQTPLMANHQKLASAPPVVVLDALDECGRDDSQLDQRRILLETITSWSQLSSSFKLVVTSRDEGYPDSFCNDKVCRRVILETGDSVSPSTNKDIHMFLKKRFDYIRDYLGLSSKWPGDRKLVQMTERAAGLFIWAKTAMEFMEDEKEEHMKPDDKLELILRGQLGKGAVNIDTLYLQVLDFHLKNVGETTLKLFRAVLGAIIVAKTPLHPYDLQYFIHRWRDDDERQICVILNRLSSVIEVDGTIRLKHLSFAEFLSDSERCHDNRFLINQSKLHYIMALNCLCLMNKELKFNICDLETSHQRNDEVKDLSSRIQVSIPTYLSYSCRFWADHLGELMETKHKHGNLLGEMRHFFYTNLLYWFEVLSLIQKVSLASVALSTAARWTATFDSELSAFARDAGKFVINFQKPVSESAPHLYLSALPFSPSESRISKHFLPQFPQTISVVTGLDSNWSTLTNVLTGHMGDVHSAEFSPDGKRIVSGSLDGTIRIWDAETGQMVLRPLRGHLGAVWSVAFSPDGKSVVSGSEDMRILVWDTETGQTSSDPFMGCAGIYSVTFSPDGTRILSCSSDNTIRIWDVKTGQIVSSIGHIGAAWSVKFSPDGQHVVSGSHDMTVRIWDVETGQMVSAFQGHTGPIRSVAFSPDGRHVASGSEDRSIQIWDVKTGRVKSDPLEGHMLGVCSVAFSPDGKCVVSGSQDETIRIWDVERCQMSLGPLVGHTCGVRSVAFSPDGKRVVSGSHDATIRIWDAEIEETTSGPVEGHTDGVCSVAFSPDGKYVVSGSEDKTVRIWNVETGQMISSPFRGHTGSVYSVSFSPDGKRVVSGSRDKTIQIWDVRKGGMASGPLIGHRRGVYSVAFSPDGERIVSGSADKTIRIWDAKTGQMGPGLFEGHTFGVCSVAFSPDGKRIVSGSHDKTIQIWDVDTGQRVFSSSISHTICCVAFSPDGERIVSGSHDKTVRIWDATSSQMSSSLLEGHTGTVSSVAFSPDGVRIVSSSHDKTIRIWDAETGHTVLGPFYGHTDGISSVAFSSNGKCVASASIDKTVRIWAAETGPMASESYIDVTSSHPLHKQAVETLKNETVPVSDEERVIPDNGFRVDLRTGGWVFDQGSRDSLLLWVPPNYRESVCTHRTLRILGTRRHLLLFDRFVHGSSWNECHRSHPHPYHHVSRADESKSLLPMTIVVCSFFLSMYLVLYRQSWPL